MSFVFYFAASLFGFSLHLSEFLLLLGRKDSIATPLRTLQEPLRRGSRPPFHDTNTYNPPAAIPRCKCGGRIRPHICWFGEVPFELNRIYSALDQCTMFMAIGTSGVVEFAASFVAHVVGRARTIYVGPEEPANASTFTECHLGKAGCQIC